MKNIQLNRVDIVQWKEDCAIPRQEFLKMAKGTDGILCLLTDKIDAELLDAAGKLSYTQNATSEREGGVAITLFHSFVCKLSKGS